MAPFAKIRLVSCADGYSISYIRNNIPSDEKVTPKNTYFIFSVFILMMYSSIKIPAINHKIRFLFIGYVFLESASILMITLHQFVNRHLSYYYKYNQSAKKAVQF